MKALQRYAVVETLKVFLIGLLATLVLMTVAGAARDGLRRGLPPHLVVQIVPYLVPEMLRFTLPACLLFAVCTVFGRMAAANELLAVKAAGVSPFQVVWPVLIVAYLLSLTTFWIYDVCARWSRPGLASTIAGSADEIACHALKGSGSFSVAGVSVLSEDVVDRRLIHPTVIVEARGNTPSLTVTAREAELRTSPGKRTLDVVFRDGNVEIGSKGSLRFPGTLAQQFDLGSGQLHDENLASPAAIRMGNIARQISREKKWVERLEREAASAAPEVATGIDAHLDHHEQRLFRLQAERQRRLANGFGCFCFALVGIPVAMWRRSADAMSVFFLCFGPILLVYYPLMVVGETAARAGILPGVMVWLADICLAAAGAILFRTLARH